MILYFWEVWINVFFNFFIENIKSFIISLIGWSLDPYDSDMGKFGSLSVAYMLSWSNIESNVAIESLREHKHGYYSMEDSSIIFDTPKNKHN